MVTVQLRSVDDATVIWLGSGAVDGELLVSVAESLDEIAGSGPVIIDLSDITLANASAVRQLVGYLERPGARSRYRILSTRLSARRLLRRFGNGGLEIFPTLELALGPGPRPSQAPVS